MGVGILNFPALPYLESSGAYFWGSFTARLMSVFVGQAKLVESAVEFIGRDHLELRTESLYDLLRGASLDLLFVFDQPFVGRVLAVCVCNIRIASAKPSKNSASRALSASRRGLR